MSKQGKHPLEDIAKFYEKCVKDADKKGFAEIYKKATELLFERLKKETNLDLHFEDINYLDGYFIFGYGTNSVVHFHIKEAPGWLFGIWWRPVAEEGTENKKHPTYKTDRLSCEFFFQFEEEIDKFKPTASTFGGNFEVVFAEGYCYSGWIHACADLKFVIKEPYLAFYREMHYANFNHEYVSRESAKRYWNRHWKEKAKEKEIDKTNAKAMFEMVKHVLGPIVEDGDGYILDRGNCISPRYEIVIKNIKLKDGKPLVEKAGLYSLFDFKWEDYKEDQKLWKKTVKECAKREKSKFYFSNQFSDACLILDTKDFNKRLKEAIAENGLLYGKLADGTIYEGDPKGRFED